MRYLAYIFITILIVLAPQTASTQGIQGAIAFGTNLSQVDGDEVVGFKKFGINASAIAIMPFKKRWAISIEASFSQKGAYEKYPRNYQADKLYPYYNLRLNYAEVPVLLHFTDKGFLTAGLGLSWGRLVGVKEIEWGKQTDLSLYSGDYARNDLNGIFDLRIPIYKKLKFNFRYSYSFMVIRNRTYTNIAGDTWTRKQYNNILTFRIYYIFNEPKNADNG